MVRVVLAVPLRVVRVKQELSEVSEDRIGGQQIERILVAFALPSVSEHSKMIETQYAKVGQIGKGEETLDVVVLAQQDQLLDARHSSDDGFETRGVGVTGAFWIHHCLLELCAREGEIHITHLENSQVAQAGSADQLE